MEPWQQEDGEDHYHDDEDLTEKVEAQAFNHTALAVLLVSKTGEVPFRFLGRGHSRASHPRYQGTCLGHPILISKVKVIVYVRFCYPHLLL